MESPLQQAYYPSPQETEQSEKGPPTEHDVAPSPPAVHLLQDLPGEGNFSAYEKITYLNFIKIIPQCGMIFITLISA